MKIVAGVKPVLDLEVPTHAVAPKKYASAKRASPTPTKQSTSTAYKFDGRSKAQRALRPLRRCHRKTILISTFRKGKSAKKRSQETALLPLHAAVSKPAPRAYLGTFLVALTSILLLCVSTVAYTLFYYNYVPQNSVERVVHLQFGCAYLSLPPCLSLYTLYFMHAALFATTKPPFLAGKWLLDTDQNS